MDYSLNNNKTMQILKEKSNDYLQCNNWGTVVTKRTEVQKNHNRHFIL